MTVNLLQYCKSVNLLLKISNNKNNKTKGIIERLIHFFGESFAAPSLKYLSERECQRCYRLSIKFRDFCNIELAKLSKNKNKVS